MVHQKINLHWKELLETYFEMFNNVAIQKSLFGKKEAFLQIMTANSSYSDKILIENLLRTDIHNQ